MKLYGTLLVRNELDIIHYNIKHHLPMLERLYVLDNNSDDGTWEYLQYLAKNEPKIILLQEKSEAYNQQNFVNNLILQAKKDGADWVLNLDADEFLIGSPGQLVVYCTEHNFNYMVLRVYNYKITYMDNNELDPTKRMLYRDKILGNSKMFVGMKDFNSLGMGGHGVKYDNEFCSFIPNYLHLNHYAYRNFDQFCRKIIQGSMRFLKSEIHKQEPEGPWADHWLLPYNIFLSEGFEGLKDWYYKNIFFDSSRIELLEKI